MAIFNHIPKHITINYKSLSVKKLKQMYSEDMLRIEGDGSYATIYFINAQKLLVSRTLKKIALELSLDQFVRIHRKHLINPSHITALDLDSKNIKMIDDTVLPISRRQIKIIKYKLQNHFSNSIDS